MKRLLALLLGLLFLLCACSAPAAQKTEQTDTPGEDAGQTENTESSTRLNISQEPITRANLSLYDYAAPVGGESGGVIFSDQSISVKDLTLQTLPVFKNVEARGVLKSLYDKGSVGEAMTEAEITLVKKQMADLLACFPDTVAVEWNVDLEFMSADADSNLTARAGDVEIWGRPGKILIGQIGFSPDWGSVSADELCKQAQDNATLKAVMSYLGIDDPQGLLQRKYDSDATRFELSATLFQKKEDPEESILSSNFGCIRLEYDNYYDTDSLLVWVGTEDLSQVVSRAPILSYEDAVLNLLDGNYRAGLVMSVDTPSLKEEDIVGCRITYRYDLFSDWEYYIPCYEFQVKGNRYTEDFPSTLTLIIPACNVERISEN